MADKQVVRFRPYSVSVAGLPPYVVTAKSRAAAIYDAFQSYSECRDIKFKDFLRLANARLCAVPEPDGYDYIRRAYGVDVKVGERVTITREGRDLEGKGATIVYPGHSTSYVRLVIDGEKCISNVHPRSIVQASKAAAPPADAEGER